MIALRSFIGVERPAVRECYDGRFQAFSPGSWREMEVIDLRLRSGLKDGAGRQRFKLSERDCPLSRATPPHSAAKLAEKYDREPLLVRTAINQQQRRRKAPRDTATRNPVRQKSEQPQEVSCVPCLQLRQQRFHSVSLLHRGEAVVHFLHA